MTGNTTKLTPLGSEASGNVHISGANATDSKMPSDRKPDEAAGATPAEDVKPQDPDGIHVTVKDLNGNRYPITITPNMTINDLKQHLQGSTLIPQDKLVFVYRGKMMEGGILLLVSP